MYKLLIPFACILVFSFQAQAGPAKPVSGGPDFAVGSDFGSFVWHDQNFDTVFDRLHGAHSSKDIAPIKKKLSEIEESLAKLLTEINHKISSNPAEVGKHKAKREGVQKRRDCVRDINNLLNDIARGMRNFPETICEGSDWETSLRVNSIGEERPSSEVHSPDSPFEIFLVRDELHK